jgi:hypothetical protein
MQQVAVDVRPYLAALHEIERECAEQHQMMCSTSLILHPSGSGAVEIDFIFSDRPGIVVDFDEGYINEAIQRLTEKVRQTF